MSNDTISIWAVFVSILKWNRKPKKATQSVEASTTQTEIKSRPIVADRRNAIWLVWNWSKHALHGAIDDAEGKLTGLYITENECFYGYFEVMRQTVW